jgi:hypothetical protein
MPNARAFSISTLQDLSNDTKNTPNARCFGSCCWALNIRESRRTPNPQLFQVLGFTPTLGQVRVATMELWVINSQFHRFLKLCSYNGLSHGWSCCFLKAKGHPSKLLLKFNPRVGSWKKDLRLEFLLLRFFRSTLLRVSQVGSFLLVRSTMQAPLFVIFPHFFFVFVPLCPILVVGSIVSRCNGWVFPLLLKL